MSSVYGKYQQDKRLNINCTKFMIGTARVIVNTNLKEFNSVFVYDKWGSTQVLLDLYVFWYHQNLLSRKCHLLCCTSRWVIDLFSHVECLRNLQVPRVLTSITATTIASKNTIAKEVMMATEQGTSMTTKSRETLTSLTSKAWIIRLHGWNLHVIHVPFTL